MWNGSQGRCLLRGIVSFETSAEDSRDREPSPLRCYCAWHASCRRSRIGGRYRSEFVTWLEEQRRSEKAFVVGELMAPSTWYRYQEQDLWEAVHGVRALPALSTTPRFFSDEELEGERRIAPPSLVREVFGSNLPAPNPLTGKVEGGRIGGMVLRMLDGEMTVGEVRQRIADRMARHLADATDQTFDDEERGG